MVADDAVRTLVHRPAVDVLPETPLRAVARTLTDESVGIALVLAPWVPGQGRRAAGLVSERDVVQAVADGLDLDRTRAEDVMTVDLASVAPNESVRTAAQRMLANEIRHLPVIEGEVVKGVVSMRDALQALLGEGDQGGG